MLHAVSPRSSSAAAFLRALAMLLLPLFGSLQAQNNVQMVAGHYQAAQGFHSFDVTVFAMQLKNGNVIGWLSYERVFDNGTNPPFHDIVDAPIEELIFDGDTAYIRVGTLYVALRDHSNGGVGQVDEFQYLRSWPGTMPPLSVNVWLLNQFFNVFGGIEMTLGNIHVQC